jgi:hypothetical protein
MLRTLCRHAGETDVREEATLMGVDLVFDQQLLGLAPAHVRLRLVIRNHQLDGPAVDAAGLVDAVDRHLRTHERCLAAGGRCA